MELLHLVSQHATCSFQIDFIRDYGDGDGWIQISITDGCDTAADIVHTSEIDDINDHQLTQKFLQLLLQLDH